MRTVFTDIREERQRTGNITIDESMNWFRRQISKLRGVSPASLMRNTENLESRVIPNQNRLYMFMYDPKTKNKLPYYDTFPLIIPVQKYSDGFLGLNLHYLPPKYRKALLDRNMNRRIDYNSLKKNKYTKPTIKRYLNKYVRSKFLRIDEEDWETSIYLPVEQFVGAKNRTVWKNSI